MGERPAFLFQEERGDASQKRARIAFSYVASQSSHRSQGVVVMKIKKLVCSKCDASDV